MAEQRQRRLHNFASLRWYEEGIRFVFTFAAKTSEVLLAAGLTVSTANFLTDGKTMENNNLATTWARAQALAIDSSLGVTFYYVFMSIKQRDWAKVCCYGLLTLLLAVVAGTITNVDTFSHAIHIPIATAIAQVGLNVKLLTTLRAIAVVGFVLMSRLKDMSFKELYEATSSTTTPPLQTTESSEEMNKTATLLRNLIAEVLAQQGSVVVTEQQEVLLPSGSQGTKEPSRKPVDIFTEQSGAKSNLEEQDFPEQQEETAESRESRLASAYQELEVEGKRVSGRALAARVHVRRSTCNQWLATHHPEVLNDELE